MSRKNKKSGKAKQKPKGKAGGGPTLTLKGRFQIATVSNPGT